MRLLLNHYGVAVLPCEQCQAMMHDMETGKPVVRFRGPNREPFNLTPANSGYKAPCRTGWKCPKGTPETAWQVMLNARNRRTLNLYLQARATGFRFVPTFDVLMADNFAIIDDMLREKDRERQADSAAAGFIKVLPFLKG